MMTTMAALLGAVPLMLGHGTGSELRQPLGYTMFGGLIVSQALTLFTTPIIYLYLDRVNWWLTGDADRQEPQNAPPRGHDEGATREREPELPFDLAAVKRPVRDPEWADERAKAAE